MGECNNPYADFARRMLAKQEAANYAAMLADDIKRCGCGGKCGLGD